MSFPHERKALRTSKSLLLGELGSRQHSVMAQGDHCAGRLDVSCQSTARQGQTRSAKWVNTPALLLSGFSGSWSQQQGTKQEC